jgi:CRISPR/Cas system-associated exonuclease Cas4 (RecB family)
MEYFLQRIARLLKEEHGNTLNRHCLVFPGRRAGLYLVKYLSSYIEKPVWLPSILTINDLFRTYSHLQPAANEILLFQLYKSYSLLSKAAGSFDDFYFWGDMLINDFDDVDKYLVDASKLFVNVRDLKEIDQRFGELTDEQKDIIRQFWTNVDIARPTNEKNEFVSLWAVLNDLYEHFRGSLRKQNLSYEGMIFRDVAESNRAELTGATQWDTIHFIGFNALNECEKKLMKVLHDSGNARFYWDYDESYIDEKGYNSAGFFMKDNIRMFGNDMPGDWNYKWLYRTDSGVRRQVVETSSDTAQVKIVSDLVASIPGLTAENAHHTAVVLADENLLMPLLTSLPSSGLNINITMGYPLRHTTVYTLISYLTELQRLSINGNEGARFSAETVKGLIDHPLIREMMTGDDEAAAASIWAINSAWIPSARLCQGNLFTMLFRKCDSPAGIAEWLRNILSSIALHSGKDLSEEEETAQNIRNEFIYRVSLALNRLDAVISGNEVTFSASTYIRILERLIRNQSVPFSGEPLLGIQIMGILETRALDFRNLIMLSMNEGIVPAVSSASSFIPFSLRQAFGMPSVNHQESIFAYHFYRLIQRSENITFVYNSNSEGLRSGEMSRFLTQMNFDKSLKPEFRNVSFEIRSPLMPPETVKRTAEHVRLLGSRYYANGSGRMLSPSAINSWLNCRMQFFYRYVLGIREPEDLSGEIDSAMFGSILHEVMRTLYSDFIGMALSKEAIRKMTGDDEMLQKAVSDAITREFRNGEEGVVTGNELIVREVLLAYLKRILKADASFAPVTILNLEEKFDFTISLKKDEKESKVTTGGIIDRIDYSGGSTRIVDYKTGNIAPFVCSVDDLFKEDRKKEYDGWLQILLYSEAYLQKLPGKIVQPSIYGIKKMTGGKTETRLLIKPDRTEAPLVDYLQIRDQFMQGLRDTISKIFDPGEDFTMTRTDSKCAYCKYRILCMR